MRVYLFFVSLLLAATASRGQNQEKQATRPHVVVVGVKGMELDVIRPLLLKGAMPNLERVISNGAYGKLRTVSAPKLSACLQHNFYQHRSGRAWGDRISRGRDHRAKTKRCPALRNKLFVTLS
jgi:hypothetical protein